jgi:branched-chain amino acid transport system permease protein
MPDLKPFIISGLALGGVYALSGVGLVVLYRTTAVLNFAYGAYGAIGALVAWQLITDGQPEAVAYGCGVLAAMVASVVHGAVITPMLGGRDDVTHAAASLGVAVVLLGVSAMIWGQDVRSLELPSSTVGFSVSSVRVNLTQLIALALGLLVVVAASIGLRRSLIGTTMRALADDRELTAMLGVRVGRIELGAWAGIGALAGVSGLLFANLVSLSSTTLTFLVIASLAAAVVGGFESLALTFAGGLAIGVIQACATPFASVTRYREMTPFVVAFLALLIFDRVRRPKARPA